MSSNILCQIGKGAAITGGIIAGVGLVPMALGFGTGGIVAGSVAAGVQSTIGNVAAGSAFSTLTSLGMTGVFSSLSGIGTAISGGGLFIYLKNKFGGN